MKIYNDILPVASEVVARMIQQFRSRECEWYNPHNETGYQLAIQDLMQLEIEMQYAMHEGNEEYNEWREEYAYGVTTEEQYMNMMETIIMNDDMNEQ